MPFRRPERALRLLSVLTLTAGVLAAPASSAGLWAAPQEAAPVGPAREGSSGAWWARHEPGGYPRQTHLTEPPVDPSDAAIRLGLTPYHGIAPALNELQQSSDRVSVEVIGQTVTGRELYLVTLTAPETAAQAKSQQQMRDRILHQSAQAAGDRGLARSYKTPVFINNNIHGNEWEGTDAALRLIEHYATSNDSGVEQTLASTRISLVLTMNPDGRHGNTRANSAGFDLNRDFVTATQPEVRAVRDELIRIQPMLMLDLHGYVNGTLVEPATPPHGENYEYDLFIRHAYPNGLGIEQSILDLGYTEAADGVRPPQIPFRDWDEGWDDWPPIFTPQYAAYHGAASHTIEVPLRVNNAAYALPETELRHRSAINTDIAHAAMTATIGYAVAHREELIADQIEVFRRGEAGEPAREVSAELFPEIGPEDVYLTDYPRAYVIPAGDGQRSAPAAARLVDHLLANDIQVTRAQRPLTLDGTSYPAGSYVVDMHQPKRGMANAILGPGTDISERVDSMYDISGWSHGLLWGANVVSVAEGTMLRVVAQPVQRAAPTGQIEGDGDLVLDLVDPDDVAALNSLLDSGVEVQWLADGSVLVPAAARPQAVSVANGYGVVLESAPAGSTGSTGQVLDDLVVAAAAPPQEQWALREMGFEVRPVSTAALNDGFDLDEVDALYVSSGLRWTDLSAAAQGALRTFVARGGGYVGLGPSGVAINDAVDLLDVTMVRGRGDANGVVEVDNGPGPLTGGAPPHTFVYGPVWFTELGEGVVVDQSFATSGPLVSGHWRPDSFGRGGQEAAQGQAVMVHGQDETGAAVVLLGSEPLFRAHPKGQYALVAKALIWSSLANG